MRFFTWIEGAEEAIVGGERAKSTVLNRKIGYSWIRLKVKLRRYDCQTNSESPRKMAGKMRRLMGFLTMRSDKLR